MILTGLLFAVGLISGIYTLTFIKYQFEYDYTVEAENNTFIKWAGINFVLFAVIAMRVFARIFI